MKIKRSEFYELLEKAYMRGREDAFRERDESENRSYMWREIERLEKEIYNVCGKNLTSVPSNEACCCKAVND